MRYFYYLLGIISLVLLFVFSTQSIIAMRLVELRFRIQKEQMMNYELSSKTLRERLKNLFSDKDNIQAEIRLNVLESDTMNASWDGWNSSMNVWEGSGYVISSVAGFLQFKKPQPIFSEKEMLHRIQIGFSMEKRRNFLEASRIYEHLIRELHGDSEEMGFVLLHHGFCLSMVGNRKDAKDILNRLVEDFPNTHYSDNAILLLGLMDRTDKRREEFRSKSKSESELVELYYQNGDYLETIRILGEKRNLSNPETYLLSRSNEEVGRIPEAVQGYLRLLNQNNDRNIAIQANRRLMILGNFTTNNEYLQTLTQAKARSLGDISSVEMIQEGKKRLKKEEFVSNHLTNQSIKELNESLDRSVQEAIQKVNLDSLSKGSEIKNVLNAEKNSLLPKDLSLEVRLVDGRTLYPVEITRQGESFQLKMKNFPIVVQPENISSIRSTTNSKWDFDGFIVQFGSKKIQGASIEFQSQEILIKSKERELSDSYKIKEITGIRLRQF